MKTPLWQVLWGLNGSKILLPWFSVGNWGDMAGYLQSRNNVSFAGETGVFIHIRVKPEGMK